MTLEKGSPVLIDNNAGTLKFRNQADDADLTLGNAPAAHTHDLAAGATDVTATAAEVNKLAGTPAGLTSTELGYVDGVTSAIQDQLNALLAKTGIVQTTVLPSRLYASDGATLKQLIGQTGGAAGVTQNVGTQADGDRFQAFVYARGNETKLCLASYGAPDSGKFEIFINGVKDGTTVYDDYKATAGTWNRWITLTQAIVAGYNLIEFRVKDKSASSSSWYLRISPSSIA